MKYVLKIGLGIVIGVFGLVICGLCAFFGITAGGIALLGAAHTPTPISVEEPVPYNPTVTSGETKTTTGKVGSSISFEDFNITLISYELSSAYKDKYGDNQNPPEGAQFLWVQLKVENISHNAKKAPSSYQFDILYYGEKINDDFYYGNRSGYEYYIGNEVFPGVSKQGWIRFTVPVSFDTSKALIVYSPSYNINFSWSLAP